MTPQVKWFIADERRVFPHCFERFSNSECVSRAHVCRMCVCESGSCVACCEGGASSQYT
jgi:hypothetical protein